MTLDAGQDPTAGPNTESAVVQRLASAWREGRAVSAAGLEAALGEAEQAYRVQAGLATALGWFGNAPPRCWKSGGGSREAALTHAALPPAGVRTSPADFHDLVLHRPGIEAEIALRLGRELTPSAAAVLSPESAVALIDAMAVSIELVDSRWLEGSGAPALLRLADLASHGALAIGAWRPFEARDWSAQTCHVHIGAQPVFTRRGSHPLHDPAWLLPIWLRHATRHGQSVPAGTVVTTGSWVGLLAAAAGDAVTVEFPGIGSASLQL